ncbi:MAG: PLP-dependent aminotransferase family protein [Anaerolineae bacterium]|nr:PLP-dependent aminotransferase family protein [Anaerolineae bacterium]
MRIEDKLSERTQHMQASAIREILKVVAQPGMISLAGGIPAPESFPIDIIRELSNEVLDEFGAAALQYDKTEGFDPLREALINYLPQRNLVNVNDKTLTIFSGSQSILDIVAKVLITKGDKIAIEAPSYLGAISAFNAYQPEYISVATDDEGIMPDALEETLKQHTIKLIYLVPTFQNPTGRTLPLARRKRIAELIQHYDVLLLEDDPYSALRYRGEAVSSIQQFAPEHVIYSSTFSKILAPGLRIGFGIAPEALTHWLVIAKQGTDLHTQSFGQAIAALYLSGGYLTEHLPRIIELYRPRRDAMLKALETYMPQGFRWTEPEGGMFLWVMGPDGLDAENLYHQCVQNSVAFVPGRYFYFEQGVGIETLRLNFTMVSADMITQAVQTIASAAEAMMLSNQ